MPPPTLLWRRRAKCALRSPIRGGGGGRWRRDQFEVGVVPSRTLSSFELAGRAQESRQSQRHPSGRGEPPQQRH
eukprot:5826543-Pyramimonas_sp.AAC.1